MPNTRRNKDQEPLWGQEASLQAVENQMSKAMKSIRSIFNAETVPNLFKDISLERVKRLASELAAYIEVNLARSIESRSTLQDYRTNPYVLMTIGSTMKLDNPNEFAQFIANTKLYMGLETSYGKSIENIVTGMYPINAVGGQLWEDPQEKVAEFDALKGLSREDKSQARNTSVWREIDKSCVYNEIRYLTSIKSGPNTINDTQVEGMKDAISKHHKEWLTKSQTNYGVKRIDIVIGLTYGTPRTTNNKDINIIVKLRGSTFKEKDRENEPGVLTDETGLVRVYRAIGTGFWAFIANPENPVSANFAFLEVLLALAIALKKISEADTIEDRLNARLAMLGSAIANLRFPRNTLPTWVQGELGDRELFWLASAMTAFYDDGV